MSARIDTGDCRTQPAVGEAMTAAGDGVAIESVQPGTTVVVETANSVYRFVILTDQCHALATGGTLFDEPTVVRLEGASAGGTLKAGWIEVGCHLEVLLATVRITSSRVRSVSFERVRADSTSNRGTRR